MREDYRRERTSLLVWLLSAVAAGFLVQLACERLLQTSSFEQMAAVSVGALKQGYLWTLVTFPFLHRNVLHVLVVGLALFFVARELTAQISERRLAWLALASSTVGGLAWFAVHFNSGGNLMGASVILWCYFAIFASLFPNREISFLVFFVIPITTRPKYVAWAMVVLDVSGLVISELQTGKLSDYNIPHSAHLGAMIVGWLYYRYCHQANWLVLPPRAELDLPRWMKRAKKPVAVAEPAAAPSANTRQDLRAEVDRILDKINSHGFNALTADEKRVLDEARDLLSRH
jgi:membrane associated rhomboid family serine protease